MPGVRLVHPRLLWVVQRVADAFPWRTIYVFSGYRRPGRRGAAEAGTRHSMHSEARAMDVWRARRPQRRALPGPPQVEDVGCGYYPNGEPVHVNVRRPGAGHPSGSTSPGRAAVRYVGSSPGVIERGGMVWDPRARRGAAGQSGASGTTRQVEP